ncbi:MAG: GTP pyrophosphokinase [Clostridia bacterium]|nr:GTP pyrophosphokinase [Clostridia bacterium]
MRRRVGGGAHRGQKDRAGAPYILHPLRVMLSSREPLEMIAGVLHDVVEDSGIALEQLRTAGYPADVIEALDALARRPGENYGDYLARVKANPLALRVKLADLRDNLDESRIPEPSEDDRRLWQKYRRALQELQS